MTAKADMNRASPVCCSWQSMPPDFQLHRIRSVYAFKGLSCTSCPNLHCTHAVFVWLLPKLILMLDKNHRGCCLKTCRCFSCGSYRCPVGCGRNPPESQWPRHFRLPHKCDCLTQQFVDDPKPLLTPCPIACHSSL